MTNTLLVGGTGTVGSYLAEELGAGGHTVRVGSRRGGDREVRFDLQDETTWSAALAGVEAVYLLSPPGHVDAHALTAPFVATAARSVAKIVTMAARGVDFDEAIPLRKMEREVERSGVKWVHLRPDWFMQNFHTFWIAPILQGGVIPLPAADAKVAFIHARDIARAAAVALTQPTFDGQALDLTGPEALSHAEVAAFLSEASGRAIRYQPIDDDAFRAQVTPILGAGYTEILVHLFGAIRAGASARVDPALERVTGQKPIPFAEYAAQHAGAWRAA